MYLLFILALLFCMYTVFFLGFFLFRVGYGRIGATSTFEIGYGMGWDGMGVVWMFDLFDFFSFSS